jgi:hypothetical protein
MKLWFACAVLSVASLPAATLDNGERDRAMSYLHSSRKLFLDATDHLTPAQWSFKPAPERWSIAEVAEHLALTEDYLFGFVQKLAQGPAEDKKTTATDADVLKKMTDRSVKAQAPEPLKPAKKFATPQEAIAHFKVSRDKTVEYAEKTQDDLRHHFLVQGPNTNDAYQMILIIAGHTERHTLQIKEVKADPNFPKK